MLCANLSLLARVQFLLALVQEHRLRGVAIQLVLPALPKLERALGPLLRADARGFNDVAAFDAAIKNIELQIRRIHEKAKSHGRKTLRTMKVEVVD